MSNKLARSISLHGRVAQSIIAAIVLIALPGCSFANSFFEDNGVNERQTFAALEEVMRLPSIDKAKADIEVTMKETREAIDSALGPQEWKDLRVEGSSGECGGDYRLLDGKTSYSVQSTVAPAEPNSVRKIAKAVKPVAIAHGFTRVTRDAENGDPMFGMGSASGELTVAPGSKTITIGASTGCRLTDEQKRWVRETGLPYAPDDEWMRERWPFKTPDPSHYAETS